MNKIKFVFIGSLIISAIANSSVACSFSIARPIQYPEVVKYLKGSELIKLSFRQFATLTGEKENLWNNLSFTVMKMRIRHDLKKHPELTLSEYNKPKHKMGLGLKILIWVAGISLLFCLVILIIFSSGS
ncbi:MAG: hypothetical protein ABI863_23960 [Ginsengibacter sp.]